jgi:ribonuclease E
MSATQQSERTSDPDGTPSPHRFRAATVEEALRQVRASLGEDAEIVEANRIRRGGIGGFFATELGVEVVALGATDQDAGLAALPSFERKAPAAAESGNHPATADPAPVDRPMRSPLRARQAWRQAVGDELREPVVQRTNEQPMMPGLEAMLAEASRSERSTLSPAPAAPEPSTPAALFTGDVTSDVTGEETTPAGPTTFAEHFLRELIEDAEQLRRGADRNRELPPSPRTLADGGLLPHAHDPAEPPAPIRRRVALAAGATEPLVAPDVLPGMPNPLPAATEVSATPPPRAKRTRSKTAGSTPRRTRPVVAPEPAPELPLEPATAPTVAPAPAEQPAATAALTDLVDRCMQFAATADRDTAPRKIALAVTLADGGVMKLTVEMPGSR